MPRTSYKEVFIREIDELPTIAYIFELLFDREADSEWNDFKLVPLELVEFCEQIYFGKLDTLRLELDCLTFSHLKFIARNSVSNSWRGMVISYVEIAKEILFYSNYSRLFAPVIASDILLLGQY